MTENIPLVLSSHGMCMYVLKEERGGIMGGRDRERETTARMNGYLLTSVGQKWATECHQRQATKQQIY